jgi:hypothetical protein
VDDIDVDAKDNAGRTPLAYVISSGHTSGTVIASMLQMRGAKRVVLPLRNR